MAFTLDKVVPWGRSFDEYAAMFALSENDLRGSILGCGDGPASFNAELTALEGLVVSVDPLYQFTPADIRARIDATFEIVLEQTRKNANEFVWTKMGDVDTLGQTRMATMERFLEDYPSGLQDDRYIFGELPHLPFADATFDLAVCSHLLFLYSEHLSEDFHVDAITELCRVAREARVFPILELGAVKSRHLDAVSARLTALGYTVTIETVPYEFQRGGDQMMRITH